MPMNQARLITEIKADLGSDIHSLGITDDTIKRKIEEATRKVTNYSPKVVYVSVAVSNNTAVLPEGTLTVIKVIGTTIPGTVKTDLVTDSDLFSIQKYVYTTSDMADPYIYMLRKNELQNLQNFISLSDWHYDKATRTLLLSNFRDSRVVVQALQSYTSFNDVEDDMLIQYIKEYTLALCKIIEGNIRRKLQSAPGAIMMDGDALVSEGTSEKTTLDQSLPKIFQYLRFGIRI